MKTDTVSTRVSMGSLSSHRRGPGSGLPRGVSVSRRIECAARGHFFAHGFRGVTMDDLAEELGMSKKTLYAAFPSKDALLTAVLLAKFREVETDLRRITSGGADAPVMLRRLLECVQRHTGEIQPSFIRDLRRAPELFQIVERRRRTIIRRYFSRVFEQGRRAGMMRKDVPTRLAIELLLALVEAILNPAKMTELGLTPKSGYAAVLDVVLNGVLVKETR